MKTLTFDCETTTYEKGNPFSRRNWLVSIGWLSSGDDYGSSYFMSPFAHQLGLAEFGRAYEECDLVIGFNLKFDLHWIRRCEIPLEDKEVWCCQLAHFMLTAQKQAYPSLNDVAEYYKLGRKIDVIHDKYWSQGIDTPQIPAEELLEYMKQDVNLTYQIYLAQREQFKSNQQLYKLFRLACLDLMCLEEMEWNGLRLDVDLCEKETTKINARIQELQCELNKLYPSIPINWGSGDHLSAILYGGKIREEVKTQVGVYKTGAKTGLPRYRNSEVLHEMEGFFKPPKGSELKKEGFFATDEQTLRHLRGNKTGVLIVSKLLELSKLDKLLDYYQGWPELSKKKDWPDGELHGQFNQVVARTGRLSCSDPNLQNLAGEAQNIIVSRY